ncbi:MAG: sodium:solute symporter [Rhodothermaceae bacterium]|nr:MAG: sodium:solute symporter [Rhodothermaceae bacterium]GIV60753.1 MAG: sodium:solute symporter [Rhodothermaceae bacterium]
MLTDHTIGWGFFLAYLLLVGGAALLGMRGARGLVGFSVGSRTVSPVMVGLSLAANLTSAATFVINPGLVYLYGWAGYLGYGLATPLGILVGLIVLSRRFRQLGDRHAALTLPQWIATRFDDRRLGVLYALLSLLLVTFMILIVVGLARVLASVLGIGLVVALVLTIAIPLVYLLLGGAGAHTLTNTAQALIMLVVAVLLVGSGLAYWEGGLSGLLARLAAIDPNLARPVNPESLLFRSSFEVFVANFVVGVAVITQPHLLSKALYLRSEADVGRYLLVGFGVAFVFFSVLLTGLYARLLMPDAGLVADAVIPTYLVERFGPVVRGLITIGLLAAGYSTLEGLMVALAAIVANDLYRSWALLRGIAPEVAERRALRLGKLTLVVLAPVLFVLGYDQLTPALSVAILAQNGVYALFAATFAPVLMGVLGVALRPRVVVAAALSALVIHFGIYYGQIGPYWNNPAVPATWAVLGSTAVALLGRWTQKKAAQPAT